MNNPNCDTFFTTATAFLSSLSLLFWGSSLSPAFYLVVRQPCNEETNTCFLTYNPFLFFKIGTRSDANIHKAVPYRYLSNNIYTVVEEWTLGYFSFSTHFYLVKRAGSEGVAAVCSGFCARSWVSWRNCNGLLTNTGLFLSTGNRYLFLLRRHFSPFDS